MLAANSGGDAARARRTREQKLSFGNPSAKTSSASAATFSRKPGADPSRAGAGRTSARSSMKKPLGFLTVLGLFLASSALAHAASLDSFPSYGPELEGFDYPWPVSHFQFASQGADLH